MRLWSLVVSGELLEAMIAQVRLDNDNSVTSFEI